MQGAAAPCLFYSPDGFFLSNACRYFRKITLMYWENGRASSSANSRRRATISLSSVIVTRSFNGLTSLTSCYPAYHYIILNIDLSYKILYSITTGDGYHDNLDQKTLAYIVIVFFWFFCLAFSSVGSLVLLIPFTILGILSPYPFDTSSRYKSAPYKSTGRFFTENPPRSRRTAR